MVSRFGAGASLAEGDGAAKLLSLWWGEAEQGNSTREEGTGDHVWYLRSHLHYSPMFTQKCAFLTP